MERRTLITTILVFLFSALLLLLYTDNRRSWQQTHQELRQQNDSLRLAAEAMQSQIEQAQYQDSLLRKRLYESYFDPYDAEKFRVYGLYRDPARRYDASSIAERFNIETPSAVKYSRVLEEDWYIVPVKGLHWVSAGDTPEALAKRYYFSPKDADLIRAFNPTIKPGRWIFIPFN
ncbi:MAG: hypothetical protein ACFCUI_10870 [Bernardetiaceae bacterium]